MTIAEKKQLTTIVQILREAKPEELSAAVSISTRLLTNLAGESDVSERRPNRLRRPQTSVEREAEAVATA